MNSIFDQNKADSDIPELGDFITSWKYNPPRSNKFLFSVIGLIGALIIFGIYYGEQFLPWLKKVPAMLIYGLLFLLSPLFKYISGLGKDQEWTLFKNGYKQKTFQKGRILEEKTGWWKDYKTCDYDAKGVRLYPNTPLQRSVRLFALNNKTEVYSICRERISLAYADYIEKLGDRSKGTVTPQQRYLQRIEQRKARQGAARREM